MTSDGRSHIEGCIGAENFEAGKLFLKAAGDFHHQRLIKHQFGRKGVDVKTKSQQTSEAEQNPGDTRKRLKEDRTRKQAALMGKVVAVVESPAKAKTIEKYLEQNYVVSYGDIRDQAQLASVMDTLKDSLDEYQFGKFFQGGYDSSKRRNCQTLFHTWQRTQLYQTGSKAESVFEAWWPKLDTVMADDFCAFSRRRKPLTGGRRTALQAMAASKDDGIAKLLTSQVEVVNCEDAYYAYTGAASWRVEGQKCEVLELRKISDPRDRVCSVTTTLSQNLSNIQTFNAYPYIE
ncbi:hypothetical protein SELMODRAFT_411187 [Selaginella moellendorffii]|uniref:Uncharacterized protein n=1 Tax=Selaginella moellendorffii TaxID=88036 RepID=D8RGU8_SELML|nr:hypothetical protein SELMODRAFT_411187 [Selaginella moellendorffii]